MTFTEEEKIVGAFWDAQQRPRGPHHVPAIRMWQNSILCGEPLNAFLHHGVIRWLRDRFPRRIFLHAISVGCGSAANEVAFLKHGVVERFTCYELSPDRASAARRHAEKQGVGDRIEIRLRNPFSDPIEPSVDLVLWMASLHHMPDAMEALDWSRRVLKPGGVMALREFVGPSALQFSQDTLDIANALKKAMPAHWFSERGRRVTLDQFRQRIAKDPSECADSGSILRGLKELWPDAHVKNLGGMVWFLALRGAYSFLAAHDKDGTLCMPWLALEDFYKVDHCFVAAA